MTTALCPPDLHPGLVALIDRVAERQRRDFGHMASDLKADGSLITACDRWSDATLVEGLAELFPGEGVLSEEGDKRVPLSRAYWVVDPLDGTTNFAAGIPYWAISLARFEAGVPVLAVLDVPPLRQRIVAIRGRGAWRNGKPLQPPSLQSHPAGCASLCSRSIGVLQKLPHQRFPGKIRLLSWRPIRRKPSSGFWTGRATFLDCAPEAERSLQLKKARADGVVSFLSRREATAPRAPERTNGSWEPRRVEEAAPGQLRSLGTDAFTAS
jgi:fructose-1,6-bisphosphatase/inositol monophosphatase family enzyme